MHKIDNILKNSDNIKEFVKSYFSYIGNLLDGLDLDTISAFFDQIQEAREKNSTVFFIGNGGSAATASHMANDFGTDIHKRTDMAKPFRAMSLTDNCVVMLAVANDTGYENLFVNQLRIHYQPGDKLVAISASGNSPNIVAAAKWVKNKGGIVMALVGFDGGKLKEIADVVIQAKSMEGEYGPVEDVHLIMGHLLSYWLQYQIKKEQNMERK